MANGRDEQNQQIPATQNPVTNISSALTKVSYDIIGKAFADEFSSPQMAKSFSEIGGKAGDATLVNCLDSDCIFLVRSSS